MRVFWYALAFAVVAAPAQAEPITAVFAAVSTFLASGTTLALVARIVLGVALSAISAALQKKPELNGSVKTESTTAGGTTSQSFILGRYFTAGNLVAPLMSHDRTGAAYSSIGAGKYRTIVADFGDKAVEDIRAIFINDQRFEWPLTGNVDADYGFSPLADGFADNVWVKNYNGRQTVADPGLIKAYGAHPERPWTSDMVLTGVPYAIFTVKLGGEFTTDPRIGFEVEGLRLYDPRKDTTVGGSGSHRWGNESTWEFTENPIVMVYNIMRGIDVEGTSWGVGVDADDLPLNNWIAAMNACPERGQSRSFIAGYEVRIADDEPLEIIDELLKACSAEFADVGGTYYVRVGGPGLPVKFITDDDILRTRAQELDPFPGLTETFNAVHARFPAPASKWEAKEAPPIYDAAAEAEDGRRLVADITLSAAPNKNQVNRLMRAWLKDARRMRRHTISLMPDATDINPLEVVSWTSAHNGYTAKEFEVSNIGIDAMSLIPTFSMRERDSGDYDIDDITLPDDPSADFVYEAPIPLPGYTAAPLVLGGVFGQARPAIEHTYTPQDDNIQSITFQVKKVSDNSPVAKDTDTSIEDGSFVTSAGILAGTEYKCRALMTPRIGGRIWTDWVNVTTGTILLNSNDFEDNAFDVEVAFFNNRERTLNDPSTWITVANLSIKRVAGKAVRFQFTCDIAGEGRASIALRIIKDGETKSVAFRRTTSGRKGKLVSRTINARDISSGSGKTIYRVQAKLQTVANSGNKNIGYISRREFLAHQRKK